MAYSKKKDVRIVSMVLLLFVILFVLTNSVFADSESVDTTVIPSLSMSPNRNYFVSGGSTSVGYFEIEKGYIYHITNQSGGTTARLLAVSNEIPANNVTYSYIGGIYDGETYDYIATSSNQYLYFDFSLVNGVVVTREPLTGMSDTIDILASNVGINSIWGIFEIAIDYIWVVVLFAFGAYIIFRLIRRLTKGKSA